MDLTETGVLVEIATPKLDQDDSSCPKASRRPAYKGVRPRAYRRDPTD